MLFRAVLISQVFLMAASSFCYSKSMDPLFGFSSKGQEALVVKVLDTDTLLLENGKKIKLIGVESAGLPAREPVEVDKNGLIVEKQEATIPLEEQALAYAQSLLEGERVRLEYDVEAKDSEFKSLAYVYLADGRFVNVELLRQGFVRLRIEPPNFKHVKELRNAYQEAKKQQRGFMAD